MTTAQIHSKFKAFIPEAKIPYEVAVERLSRMVESFARNEKVAAKSVGIEFLEAEQQLVLTLGYRDDEPTYPVKLTSVSLGKLALRPEVIEAAMSKAAEGTENVICHEFFVTDQHEYVMVLLSRA